MLKSKSGISMISLMVYLIVLTVVIGTASMLMKYFYKNEKETTLSTKTSNQYTRFVTYITEDVNSR